MLLGEANWSLSLYEVLFFVSIFPYKVSKFKDLKSLQIFQVNINTFSS